MIADSRSRIGCPSVPLDHECGKEKGEGDSMGKQVIYVALGVMFLVLGSLAEAQQSAKVSRIGYLALADPARESARSEAIRLALRELGHVEGQNIAPSTDMRRGSSIA